MTGKVFPVYHGVPSENTELCVMKVYVGSLFVVHGDSTPIMFTLQDPIRLAWNWNQPEMFDAVRTYRFRKYYFMEQCVLITNATQEELDLLEHFVAAYESKDYAINELLRGD